jgi:hypothetical protein
MARRSLGPKEQARLIREAEEARDDDSVVLAAGRIKRGTDPTAVLSVRVPLAQLRQLRSIASRRAISLSELLKEAVDSHTGTGGVKVWDSSGRIVYYHISPPIAESVSAYADTYLDIPPGQVETLIMPEPQAGEAATGGRKR